MKNLYQYVTVLIVLLHTFSCSNDFLKEELKFFGESSPIVISPDWEAGDYSIYCQGVGNARFTVADAPEWLKISSMYGQFTNSYATLNCKANAFGAFSEIGIFYSYMTLSVEGKGNMAIQAVYIVEGNPVIETQNSMTIHYHSTSYKLTLPVQNTGNGILFWSVADHPDWLNFYSNIGWDSTNEISGIIPPNATDAFYLSYNPNVYSENLSGKIVIASNDKNKPFVEIEIDLGNPALNTLESGTINFGRAETTQQFSFSNQGNGILAWKVEGCPEWLTVSVSNDSLNHLTSSSLVFTCNRVLLPSGLNTATIYLKTNDKNQPSYSITATAYGIANLVEITGNVTDVCIDRSSDILYLTTSQPNRLLAYDINDRKILHELQLSRMPNCFSMSEDGRYAVVGHSGYISHIDLVNFEVIKTIEVNCNIFDIEWGADNWICYTPGEEIQHYQLQWKNLDTDQTYITQHDPIGGMLYGKTLVKKIPNQNYIVASRIPISPSGIIVFDTQTRSQVTYFHESIVSWYSPNFWFSSDGNFLFASNKVFRTSSLLVSSEDLQVSPINKFSPEQFRFIWIDHHAASQSVWLLSSSSYFFDEQDQREIMQYEDSDYTRKKIYYYSGNYWGRLVHAHYVFANQEGSELVVIRNATSGNFLWSLEFIQVEK